MEVSALKRLLLTEFDKKTSNLGRNLCPLYRECPLYGVSVLERFLCKTYMWFILRKIRIQLPLRDPYFISLYIFVGSWSIINLLNKAISREQKYSTVRRRWNFGIGPIFYGKSGSNIPSGGPRFKLLASNKIESV